MTFKFYYYEDKEIVILASKEDNIPDFDSIKSSKEIIIINLNDKNVENLYDFFKKKTIKDMLLDSPSKMTIDSSDIMTKDFYSDETFQKLINLINELLEKCNETINNLQNTEKKDSGENNE